MTIYEAIKEDHAKARGLLEEILGTTARGEKKRGELFGKLKTMLQEHNHGEEQTLYARLLQDRQAQEHVMEGMEEHHVADLLLQELAQLAKSDLHWHPKANVLREILEHHIKEEESTTFRQARQVLNREEAQQLGEQFARAKHIS